MDNSVRLTLLSSLGRRSGGRKQARRGGSPSQARRGIKEKEKAT